MKNRDIGAGLALSEIAKHLNLSVIGAADIKIRGMTPFDCPETGCIAFSADDSTRRVKAALEKSPVTALIIKSGVDPAQLPPTISYLSSPDPMRSFIDLVPRFFEPYEKSSAISPHASVHPSVKIGSGVSIGDFVSIAADCVIGDGVTIYPQCVIYPEVSIAAGATLHAGCIIRERCSIGAQAIIQNGAVIGADGFGYVPDPVEGVRAVPQVGSVSLAARVEVGANSCIDRGAFGNTVVGMATKVDNLVQIGHNVRIGQFSFICGQVAIAGSAVLGNQVTIGGNTGIAGHLTIADRVRVAGNSGVINSLPESGDYGGFPAQPAALWRRQIAAIRKLPEIVSRLRKERHDGDDKQGQGK